MYGFVRWKCLTDKEITWLMTAFQLTLSHVDLACHDSLKVHNVASCRI